VSVPLLFVNRQFADERDSINAVGCQVEPTDDVRMIMN